MNAGGAVQRQLREDWDNREYEQIIADNIKNIANFLSSFGKLVTPQNFSPATLEHLSVCCSTCSLLICRGNY